MRGREGEVKGREEGEEGVGRGRRGGGEGEGRTRERERKKIGESYFPCRYHTIDTTSKNGDQTFAKALTIP